MVGVGDDVQLLVVARQPPERILAEIARVRTLAVEQQHGAADLAGIGQKGHVEKRQRGGRVPALVGVERPPVIAARRLVVGVIVLHELGRIGGQRIGHTACTGVGATAVILRALRIEPPAEFVACVGVHRVEIAVGRHAAHVVHRRGDGRPNARIDGSGIERHAAPAADAEDADAPGIDPLRGRKEIDRGAKVLRIDVGRRHVARLAAALARVGGVESDRDQAAFGQRLGVKPRRLLLDRPEGSADGDGRQAPRSIFRNIHVRRQRQAVAVAEGHLAVVDLAAPREYLVPLGGQIQLLVHRDIGIENRIDRIAPAAAPTVAGAGKHRSGQ